MSNIQTITFDSKKWKLVPRKVSDKWLETTGLLICDEDEEFINAVLDFAPQPETLSPWIPIESAPKDGSNFYVTGFNYGNASNGRWYDVGHVTPRGGIKSTLTWLNLDFATHWMPMPQPPEVK